jgi:hypothetical protein
MFWICLNHNEENGNLMKECFCCCPDCGSKTKLAGNLIKCTNNCNIKKCINCEKVIQTLECDCSCSYCSIPYKNGNKKCGC